jgi:hypothetical protein
MDTISTVNNKPFNLKEILSRSKITMPDRPRTTVVPPDDTEDTVRKVVEFTDYPIRTVSGRQMIRRVEKILMPNGRYRYPETYIDMTPGFTIAPKDWDKDRVKGYEIDIKL